MKSDTTGVPFVKYQGLGNDFVLIDNSKSNEPIFTPDQAVSLCDRNFGIGAGKQYVENQLIPNIV